MNADFYNHVIPAIEQALTTDLPWVQIPERTQLNGHVVAASWRRPYRHELEIYAFPQAWSDTSLGFGGIAGQAFTSAYTTVIIHELNHAAVYIGGRLAYQLSGWTPEFYADLRAHNMVGKTKGWRKRYAVPEAKAEVSTATIAPLNRAEEAE